MCSGVGSNDEKFYTLRPHAKRGSRFKVLIGDKDVDRTLMVPAELATVPDVRSAATPG